MLPKDWNGKDFLSYWVGSIFGAFVALTSFQETVFDFWRTFAQSVGIGSMMVVLYVLFRSLEKLLILKIGDNAPFVTTILLIFLIGLLTLVVS